MQVTLGKLVFHLTLACGLNNSHTKQGRMRDTLSCYDEDVCIVIYKNIML